MAMDKLEKNQLILITEDSDDDYEITLHALKKAGNLKNEIRRCENGQELLDYLNQEGEYADMPDWRLPGLILLDLNMPGVDGRAALARIKATPKLAHLPVIVLTTSDDERDIQDCYSRGANTYIQKPVNLDGFFNAIKRLTEYWFEIAILPKES